MVSEKKVKLVADMVATLEFTFQEKVDLMSEFLQQESDKEKVFLFIKSWVARLKRGFCDFFPTEAESLRKICLEFSAQHLQFEQLLKKTEEVTEGAETEERKEEQPRVKRKYTRKKGNDGNKIVKAKRPYHRRNVSSVSQGAESKGRTEEQKAKEAFDADVNAEEASLVVKKGQPPEKEGKLLPLELLYPYNVRSRKIIKGKDILGVIIPCGGGTKSFALSLKEVAEMLSLKDALLYARKYPRINGTPWEVLSGTQLKSCSVCLKDLNEVLRAVGGDPVCGDYLTNPPEFGGHNREYKIRFAVELRF